MKRMKICFKNNSLTDHKDERKEKVDIAMSIGKYIRNR